MSNCIFPMVNAWVSKKPIKYWRNFTPGDIPLSDLKQNRIKYYEWNNDFQKWMLGLLYPIERHWSISNISKMIDIHSRLINGGIKGTVIVEVHPKFRIGKYKGGIEVLSIYPENAQYSHVRNLFDIYETEYYIKHLKGVNIVTETYLEQMINQNNHCFVYSYKKGKNIFLHIKSNTNNSKNEKVIINDILSTPGLKFQFPNFSTYIYNDKEEGKWEYLNTQFLTKKVWNITKNSEPKIEIDNDNNSFNLHFTFMKFKQYYEGQIAKVKSSKIRDGLDSAFLKAAMTNRTKTASSNIGNQREVFAGERVKRSSQDDSTEELPKRLRKELKRKMVSEHKEFLMELNAKRKILKSYKKKNPISNFPIKNTTISPNRIDRKILQKHIIVTHPNKEEKEETVYVSYIKQQKSFIKVPEHITIHKKVITTWKKEVIVKDVKVYQRCQKWSALKLQERNPEVEILTVTEYNKLRSTEYQKPKSTETILHPEGTFNRKLRRLEKGKNKKRSRVVHTQYVSREISDNKIGKYPHALHANVKGDKFITPSSITGAVIKVGNQLVAKDSLKPIYHHVKPDNRIITRHNAPKHPVSPLLQELKEKYGAYDRRYTVNSDVENWSIQFFIALKMVKDKERHNKVFKYLTKTCKYSDEFAEAFIKYLQLTRNGDPTREHKKNPFAQYTRIKVTKPHIQINSPSPQLQLAIEHEVKNEEEGGVKNIITEDVYIKYNKKNGLVFFKFDPETKDSIFVCNAKTVKKWAYVQEYKEDISKAKWHDLVTVSTKEVDAIQKNKFILDQRVKGGRPKKWLTPIPVEKSVKYIIKLLLLHKKNENDVLLYSTIRNKVMNEYKDSTDLYEKLRFTLYHNYSELGKYIVTKIKTDKTDDPDLVTFMEDLMNPHFN